MKTLSGAVAALALITAGAASAAPRVVSAPYGTTAGGAAVHVYTLTNDHGFSVRVLDLGGTIISVDAPDRQGRRRNVVLGLGDLAAYGATPTLNALVGRYANRLKNGFDLDGRHYDLTAGPNGVTLHGGRDPYGYRLWAASTSASADGASLALSLVSPDGDQGFPGTVSVKVTYSVTQRDELRLDYEATTDRPTVINLTNHTYFNLAGNGSGSVYGQSLQLFADLFTPADQDLALTGETAPVAGTALDFRRLRPIGERVRSAEPQMVLAHGYDQNVVLRKPPGVAMPLAARLYDPASGRVMELRTTEPGLQVYSSNFMNGTLVSAAGTTIRQGDALALETQHFPNSPNVPGFPSTVLRPGQVLRSSTVFRFTTDKGRPLR